jgi:hypothetical protein
MDEQLELVMWGTRSYDVRLSVNVDKADYLAAYDNVGDNPADLYVYLVDIGYEFDFDEMSPIEEVITDLEII